MTPAARNPGDCGGRPRTSAPRIVVLRSVESAEQACLDAVRRKRFPLRTASLARPLHSLSAGYPGWHIMQFSDPAIVSAPMPLLASYAPLWFDVPTASAPPWAAGPVAAALVVPDAARHLVAGTNSDDDDDLGDEEDLAVSQPLADEESSFDDFDDEFDDDFEEEENDPDWDHPDDGDIDEPPPPKPPGGKK